MNDGSGTGTEPSKTFRESKNLSHDIIIELQKHGLPHAAKSQEKGSSLTVNLNQTINIHIKIVLENYLTVAQYKEVEEILKIPDTTERSSKLSDFLISVGSAGLVEIVKAIIMLGAG